MNIESTAKQVLIISRKDAILELTIEILSGLPKLKIKTVSNLNEAASFFSSQPTQFNLLIFSLPGTDLDKTSPLWLSLDKSSVPLLFISLNKLSPKRISELVNTELPHESIVTEDIPLLLGTTASRLLNYELTYDNRDYVGIKPHTLISLSPSLFPIYIQLGENKYTKIFNSGHNFEISDIDRVSKKNIDLLYIKKRDSKLLLNSIVKNLAHYQNEGSDHLQNSVSTISLILDTAQIMGFPHEISEVVKTQVKNTITHIKKRENIGKIINHILFTKDEYLGAHSLAVAEASGSIALAMDWPSDSTLSKLTYASLFHDASIPTNRIALRADHINLDSNDGYLTGSESKLIALHPSLSCEVWSKFGENIPDVEAIILQHHELPDGTGFPRQLFHSSLNPLTTIFITAHDYISYIVRTNQPITMKEWLDKTTLLQKGIFKDIAKAIQQTSVDS